MTGQIGFPTSTPRPRRRHAAVAAGTALLLAVPGLTTGPAAGSGTGTANEAEPALFSPVPAQAAARAGRPPADLLGESRLVTLDGSVLPERAAGQRIRLPLTAADGTRAVVARVDKVDHEAAYTAWTGTLPDVPLGSFTLVRVGDLYRGSVISPQGIRTLTRAEGDRYWWTEVPPMPPGATGHAASTADSAPAPAPSRAQAAAADAADPATSQLRGKRRKRIGVMFGFTAGALAEAGSRDQLKAEAAQVITETNQTLANSGLPRIKVRFRGLVKAKGTESGDPVQDAFRVSRRRDGHFDNLQRVRRRHRADIVHLFTTGSSDQLCGGGLIPIDPSSATPAAGASVTFRSCLPYLVATHEIGHNLGADHIQYAGVSHHSRMSTAWGFYNVPGGYITMMGYFNPCVDNGVSCVRLPYFSHPTRTYNGQPLGLNRYTNNTYVISQIAPKVAKYVR